MQCFGPQASRFNHRLVEGRRVRLVFGVERRDVYGRLLAYVYLGGRFVNAELLRRGLGADADDPAQRPLRRPLRAARDSGRAGRAGALGRLLKCERIVSRARSFATVPAGPRATSL